MKILQLESCWYSVGISKQTWNTGFNVRCYIALVLSTAQNLWTSNARFESIRAKQEATNTTAMDGT